MSGVAATCLNTDGNLRLLCLRLITMGNIRPTYIKRVAVELVNNYPGLFTDDFNLNKEIVGKMTDVTSTMMRNKIAGYVTTFRKHPKL